MEKLAFWPTVSTSCIVISAILVAIGWYFIKQRKIETHKKFMILAAIFATIFFVIYASRTIFFGNSSFGGPDDIKVFYHIFLIFHIILATVGAILGIRTLWLGFKNNLEKHRKLGPVTSIVWFCTGITGSVVYILLYVLYPGGETTSLLRAIFGY
jgi:putative membrane protein